MSSDTYPYPPNAIILPILAFPAWLLCIPPLVWHISQRNIAAWSLILWTLIGNFFNFINPLIWPRENTQEWYDGHFLCDVEIHFWIGHGVALAACVAMILRKLATVMDTGNITVAPSRSSRLREKVLEILICWGYPALLIIVYYIVQPLRYVIYQVYGCGAVIDSSWPSMVLNTIWGPITACFAAYYAGLLLYRLYRYRREFQHLVAARNTTKSRFLRLTFMSLIFILVYLPFNFYILWWHSIQMSDPYDWDRIHDKNTWNTLVTFTTGGKVRFDKWAQVATGYLACLVFGTGADAFNTHKRLLCAVGLGRIFPSLYIVSESGTSTPASIRYARSWASTAASTYVGKARSLFSRRSIVDIDLPTTIQDNSLTLPATPVTPRTMSLQCQTVSTNEPILQQPLSTSDHPRSFLNRIFGHRRRQQPVLPIFTHGSVNKPLDTEKTVQSPTNTLPTGVYSHAWASYASNTKGPSQGDGVHVVQEVCQERRESRSKGHEKCPAYMI